MRAICGHYLYVVLHLSIEGWVGCFPTSKQLLSALDAQRTSLVPLRPNPGQSAAGTLTPASRDPDRSQGLLPDSQSWGLISILQVGSWSPTLQSRGTDQTLAIPFGPRRVSGPGRLAGLGPGPGLVSG